MRGLRRRSVMEVKVATVPFPSSGTNLVDQGGDVLGRRMR